MCEDCFDEMDDDSDDIEVERMLCDIGSLVTVDVGLSASKAPLVVMVEEVAKVLQTKRIQYDI